jgi:site-specific DNA recombinase
VTRPATNGTHRKTTVRCEIYTRKSSEEGLEQEFNSLQAQREACEAFITSQRHEGWACLPKTYDDGEFSGDDGSAGSWTTPARLACRPDRPHRRRG